MGVGVGLSVGVGVAVLVGIGVEVAVGVLEGGSAVDGILVEVRIDVVVGLRS